MLLAEKSELELQRRTLIAAKESLSKEKTNLMVQQTTLTEDRDSLTNGELQFARAVGSISGQLAEKVAALEQVEQERERLKKQADELDAIVAGLKQRLEKLNIDLAESRALATATRTESQTKVKDLESQLAARDKTAEEYLAKLKRATTLFQGLKVEKEQLQRALRATELNSGGTARGRPQQSRARRSYRSAGACRGLV